jgi:hypothetical protein
MNSSSSVEDLLSMLNELCAKEAHIGKQRIKLKSSLERKSRLFVIVSYDASDVTSKEEIARSKIQCTSIVSCAMNH